jgi:SpoVK/Ycf46/Vps4 family AAA+-type ATPase
MDKLNINNLLNREEYEKNIIECLNNFEKNKHLLNTRRGIYIYGSPGIGKTFFIVNILKKLDYDIINYDAGDIRNKSIIETITKHNMSDKNVLSLFNKKVKKIAIIMDEIDGMNNGDKGGINALIKLIRPKKTKKQKKEEISMIPIICIGNNHIDKKMRELIKNCLSINLNKPNNQQILHITQILLPKLDEILIKNIVNYIQGDLRKLNSIYNIYKNHQSLLKNKIINNMFEKKNYNEDTKFITKKIINNRLSIDKHNIIMNETDRTSVGLLFHENIIDVLSNYPKKDILAFYCDILDNFCFSDYIDRVTFQKQIWVFNEMSSLIKTFYNNKLFHDKIEKPCFNPKNIRFTKVLTKYSTEYNNNIFLNKLCQELNMDKKDMLSFFVYLKKNNTLDEINGIFNNENYDINKLDINRIYRFLDSYIK